jgi:hypothetical protein
VEIRYNHLVDIDERQVISRLEERKRRLEEELAEVSFLIEAAVKHTKKKAYDPKQLAEARKKRWHRCDCMLPDCENCFPPKSGENQ